VLCSVTPTVDYPWNHGLNPVPTIIALNTCWIKNYAAQKAMSTLTTIPRSGTSTTVCPLVEQGRPTFRFPTGFAIMAPLAEAEIKKALER